MRHRFGKSILRMIAAGVLSAFVASSIAIAGTTGAINGVVRDESGAPLAGARVTVKSPSETVTVTTDAGGHYAFVSLAPDEYSVNVEKTGYDVVSLSGVAVFADATQVVPVTMRKTLKTIANVTSRSTASLVRPGTTADIYSVNAEQQERTNVLGGGGNLTSAYSAIAAVPGAYVPSNQNGYNQAVHVRGGDSSEVGYEFDGIPVNRGFDNYPGGGISSLGQLELQVYTGATPANAEAQGLAGFINQVIKSGTYPGYGSTSIAVGTPTFYHQANVEAGGSSPSRNFSYYAGIGGYNQDYRYIDQFNGESLANTFGPTLDQCQTPANLGPNPPPSCFTNGKPNVSAAGTPGYILGPMPFGYLPAASVSDRTTVLNLHFGLPHKHDTLRDDVQMLYDTDLIQTPLFVSPLDEGLNNFQGSLFYPIGTLPFYSDSYQYTGGLGRFLTDASAGQVVPYLFPSSPTNRELFAQLPLTTRDIQYNNQNIVKLQYQKNFSADSFLRIYGYTYYSDYISTGAVSSWQPLTGFDSGDYEVSSHTRGVSATFAKQLSAKNLFQAEASYTTSTSLRDNNGQMFDSADAFAVVVNPNDLTHGICYALASGGGAAAPTTCGSGSVISVGTPATFASLANTFTNGALTDTNGNPLTAATLSSSTCGSGPCSLYTLENGAYGKYNSVKPNFTGYSMTDEWRPNEKLLFNLGVRLDQYQYVGADTTGTAARAFWFNSFNNDTCFDTQNLTLYDKTLLANGSSIFGLPCSAGGSQYVPATMFNIPSQTYTYNIFQPRVGASWTVSPQTVLRASYGKYIEQPTAAYEQYNTLQQNLPDGLVPFYTYGFNTPGHEVRPSISYNYDFSYEHQFKGTDMSIKVTPFLRQTHDQIQNFYLNVKQGFISGFNAGNQTSRGFEFAFTKGDFTRDGFAAQLGFAYTYATIKFSVLPNGTTILSPINADIQTYNGYTKFCSQNPTNSRCGTNSSNAAPCYQPANVGGVAGNAANPSAGAADPTCGIPGDIANPYWNAPAQPLLDPNADYLPYSTLPAGVGSGVNAYTYPYVASLILQYRHNKLAITPSFQFMAGNRYGAPETMSGIDPALGCNALAGASTANDPRYPYGAAGGAPYDATTCSSTINAIPDSYTGQFDGLGAFRQPSQFLMHLRLSYDFTPRIQGIVTVANLISTCFGGQQTPFTYYFSRSVCSYGSVANQLVNPVGNVYNPGDNVQTIFRYPYEPAWATYNDLTSSLLNPLSVYFNVKIKL